MYQRQDDSQSRSLSRTLLRFFFDGQAERLIDGDSIPFGGDRQTERKRGCGGGIHRVDGRFQLL